MGKKACLIPKNNASDSEVKIIKIYFLTEDFVKNGDLLFEFETSKAAFEVFSEHDGFVKVKISEGDICKTGAEAVEFFESLADLKFSLKNENNKKDNLGAISNLVFSKKALRLIEELNIDTNLFINAHRNQNFITESMVHDYTNNSIIKYVPASRKFKKNEILIFGAGGHALQCLEIISDSKYEFIGFVANKFDNEYRSQILGSSIDDLELMYKDGLRNIIIGFGLLDNLEKRHNIYNKLIGIGFTIPNIISKSSSVSALTIIPDNLGIQIFQGAVIGPKVILRKNIVINSNATVSHHCEICDGAFIAPGAILAGGVKIGEYALIGMGATLFMNIEIPSKVIVENNSNIL